MMVGEKILQKIALYLRVRKIRLKYLAHLRDLENEPPNLNTIQVNELGTGLTNRNRLIFALKSVHLYRPLSYLLKIIQNILIKKKLRIGSSGIKNR